MADAVSLESRGRASGGPGTPGTRRRPGAAVTCLAAAVACCGAYLLILQSQFTFFADDWEILLNRRGFSAGAFLDPHNDHIVVAVVAIYKALLAPFGMGSAMPFAVVSTLVFLLGVVLLFVWMRRRTGDWPALLGSVLILFLGAAWSDLLWSFQLAYSGSVAAGMGALLALDRDDRNGDLAACGLLVLASAFSELGVPFVIGALVSVVLGPAPRGRRLYLGLVPIALYGLWYLGWGHTGPSEASFHNLVNSPRFVFDAVSQNLASLLGLATPLTGSGDNPVGLNWGRILLVIALVLAIWRLWRLGGPSRWLWAVLAAGAAFWFLTALNTEPLLRPPTSGRYQYPGAVFVLLIAAELLRGVRPDKRVLAAATAVTIAAAVSGAIYLHYGYDLRKSSSDDLRARLAAVDIGRGHESPDFVVAFHIFYARPASEYFAAVDEFGSPALSEPELAASDATDRAAADRQLMAAEGIKLSPLAAGATGDARAAGRCRTGDGSQAGLALPPGSYIVTERRLGDQGGGLPITVQAARFADGPAVNLGFLKPGASAALDLPADASSREWRLYSPLAGSLKACEAGGA